MNNGYIWLCFFILEWIAAIILAFVINPPVGWFLILLNLGLIYLAKNS
jgi:hypothetical protein